MTPTITDKINELIETLRQERPERDYVGLRYESSAIVRHACCDKARLEHCVCMYHFVCPEHGSQHIGTHD